MAQGSNEVSETLLKDLAAQPGVEVLSRHPSAATMLANLAGQKSIDFPDSAQQPLPPLTSAALLADLRMHVPPEYWR